MKRHVMGLLVAAGVAVSGSVGAATVGLFDYGFNVDGTFTGLAVPPEADASGFDFGTGLGSVSFEVTGAGEHFVAAWFDHSIDELVNTYFNETGAAVGTSAAGQWWEIDEPGWGSPQLTTNPPEHADYFGDIYWNVENSAPGSVYLDNLEFYDWVDNQFLSGLEDPVLDDVSMALGWNFDLLATDIATVEFLVSLDTPTGGFYLEHSDPDSQESIFFSSALSIQPIPEPGTLLLLGTGLVGLAGWRRRTHSA